MSNSEPAVWQVSAGPATRSFAEVFLRHGVALIGPGDSGPWSAERSDEDFDGSFVRRFVTELQLGDILLLRTAQAGIRAVGLVASEYLYLPQFDDVNGWDLQHARRVHWCPLPNDYDFGSRVFGANPPRLSRIGSFDILEYAHRFVRSPPTDWQAAPLPPLPPEEPALDAPPPFIAGLVAQVHDLFGLYWDPAKFGERPTEDELVAHYVVPMLRALGWPAERIAVKWRNVDVAVFHELPRLPENCAFIVEAKRLGAGVEGALAQAKRYLAALGISCDAVVTDGIRYRLYDSRDGFAPVAYANLARLKCGALELFSHLKRS